MLKSILPNLVLFGWTLTMSNDYQPDGHHPDSNASSQQPHGPAPTGPIRGSYPEIAPGVPRYGQYAPGGQPAPTGQQPPINGQPGYGGLPPYGQQSPYGQPAPGIHTPLQRYGHQQTGGWQQQGQPQRPSAVLTACILIAVASAISAALMVFYAVLVFTADSSNPIKSQVFAQLQDQADRDNVNLETVWSLLGYMSVGALIVLTGLAFLIAVNLWRGRNWARVLGTVLAALSLITLLLINPILIVLVALGVIAMVLTWLPASADFFARRSGAQRL